MNKDYIMPGIAGRIGNNLFMIAHAYAQGLKYNKQVLIPRIHIDYNEEKMSENIFKKLEYTDKDYVNNGNWNPVTPSNDKHTLYSGYFQSEKYFEEYSENIKSLFGPSLDFKIKMFKEIPQLFMPCTAINVRRGDYLPVADFHPVVSLEYINHCITLIENPGQFIIASDDIHWCKEHIKIPEAIFIEGYKAYEQMWILSMCDKFIISNSSFSWWAAYLSRAENKIVLAPETWFGPKGPPSWQDMYCKDWTIVPTKYSNRQIFPKRTQFCGCNNPKKNKNNKCENCGWIIKNKPY